MRFLSTMLKRLGRPKERVSVPAQSLPARITPREKRELADARVRIPSKWDAFDRMVADYGGSESFLSGRRK